MTMHDISETETYPEYRREYFEKEAQHERLIRQAIKAHAIKPSVPGFMRLTGIEIEITRAHRPVYRRIII